MCVCERVHTRVSRYLAGGFRDAASLFHSVLREDDVRSGVLAGMESFFTRIPDSRFFIAPGVSFDLAV